MNKTNNITHGLSFRLTKLVQGLLLGFLSLIPFMNSERLKEIFNSDEDKFLPYGKRINNYFIQNITTIIGVLIGILCFFYIPVSSLLEMMGKPIYLFLMSLSLGFVITDIYLIFRKNYLESISVVKIIKIIILFLIGLVIPFLLSKIKLNTYLDASLISKDSIVIISVVMLLAGILYQYGGYSLGTFLALGSIYLSISNPLYDVVRIKGIKEYSIFLLVFLVSFAIGTIIGYVIKARRRNEKERSSLNLGLVISSLYFFYTNYYKNASYTLTFENEATTTNIKKILSLTLLATGFIVSIVLSIHCYRFLNKKETKEEQENPNYNLTILTDGLIEDQD